MKSVHPSAIIEAGTIIEDGAVVGENVRIGHWCHVGSQVRLDAGCRLHSHVVVGGDTHLGQGCEVFPFAAVGLIPQDTKYAGEETRLTIGARTVVREHVTIHLGTKGGDLVTRIGEDCLLMVGAHVAHDCTIGNHVILVNNVAVGGHVQLDDWVILGAQSGVHQFVHIGTHSMIGAHMPIKRDVLPYAMVDGIPPQHQGPNLTGLRRRGFAKGDINAIRATYEFLASPDGEMEDKVAHVQNTWGDNPSVAVLVRFFESSPEHGKARGLIPFAPPM